MMRLPRAMDQWLLPYWRRPRHDVNALKAVFLAVCDHYEPHHQTDAAGALKRVRRWRKDYPRSIQGLTDDAGREPRHTFFYPIEQVDGEVLKELGGICEGTGSEVEVHLHHADDNATHLEAVLEEGKARFVEHGFLHRDAEGQVRYGFIHGNWAIGNCHPKGAKCGVQEELAILKRTGCYADFTMPSAPDVTQLPRVNALYHAPLSASGRAVAMGPDVGAHAFAEAERSGLLMVQGPLGWAWQRRKWGLVPKVENGDLTGVHPPSTTRLHDWLRLAPRVSQRPDWAFVKLHTHGAIPRTSTMFLDGVMRHFHQRLRTLLGEMGIALYYVTAREMAAAIKAAACGQTDPARSIQTLMDKR